MGVINKAEPVLRQKHLLWLIPLILSAYTHLWNAVGFPDFFLDEGVYMRRAFHVLAGMGPQEPISVSWYDHPYFGQIFLAFVFKIIGYPDSLDPKADENQSIEMLYLVPRILMGLLAVLDTLFVYKIGDKIYNRKVGFVASIFFAVMTGTWILRRIFLDSILLPFLLASILAAISIDKTKDHTDIIKGLKGANLKNCMLTMFSGVFLGIAIFTKIPIFAMIPLIALLILMKNNCSTKSVRLKLLGLWFIPVILIPAIWPLYAISIDQFIDWKDGVFKQINRNNGGLVRQMEYYSKLDPVMLILGILGFAYAAIRKQWFTIIWIVPFLLFLYSLTYSSFYYIIPVLPIFCISAAWLVLDAPVWISQKLRSHSLSKYSFASVTIVLIVSGIGIISTSLLLDLDASRAEMKAALYTGRHLVDNVTLISNPVYSWIPQYVFNHSETISYWSVPEGKVQYEDVILLADSHLRSDMKKEPELINLWSIYNMTTSVIELKSETTDYDSKKYPYTSLQAMREGAFVEIRNGSHISID